MQVYSCSASIYTNYWSMVCEFKPQHVYNYPNSPIHSLECCKFREIWIQVNKGTAFYQCNPQRGRELFLTSSRDQLRSIRWAQASTRTLQVYMKAKWCVNHQGVGDIIINLFSKDLHNICQTPYLLNYFIHYPSLEQFWICGAHLKENDQSLFSCL